MKRNKSKKMVTTHNNRIFYLVIILVAMSVVASYLHRYFVVDRAVDQKNNIPVVTDKVISATGPITQLTAN